MILETAMLMGLLGQCQHRVETDILKRLIDIESSRNPYAIAVVGATAVTQPQNQRDAIAIAHDLDSKGVNYSLGLMQINKHNLATYGLTIETAFDGCRNIQAGAAIYAACLTRAESTYPSKSREALLNDAASCYYSGNFTRGYQPDHNGVSYVSRFQSTTPTLTQSVPPPSKSAIEDISPSTTAQPWDVFGDFSLKKVTK